MSGRGTLVRDQAKINEVWKEPFKVWFPGGKTDPEIALIAVTLDEAEFWDNQGMNKVQYVFESAKAYLTGTTPETDEGDQHAFVKL